MPVAPDGMGMDPILQIPRRSKRWTARPARARFEACRGGGLARSLGLAAEPHDVPDELDVADTLIDIARQRGAAVVVVAHTGSPAFLAPAGGVSRKLIGHCDRPVLVIRGERH